jgi:hypothetical protein
MNWFNVIRKGTIEMDGRIHVISDKIVALGDKVIDNLNLEEINVEDAIREAAKLEAGQDQDTTHYRGQDIEEYERRLINAKRNVKRLEKEKDKRIANATRMPGFSKHPEKYLDATDKTFAKLLSKLKHWKAQESFINARIVAINEITQRTNERNAEIVAAKTGNIFAWAEDLGIDMRNVETVDEFLLYMNYRGYEPEAFEGLKAVVPQATSVGTTQSEYMTQQTSGESPFREKIREAIRMLLKAGEDLSMTGQRYLKVQNHLNIGMDEWTRNEMMVVDEIYDSAQAKAWEKQGQQEKQWADAASKKPQLSGEEKQRRAKERIRNRQKLQSKKPELPKPPVEPEPEPEPEKEQGGWEDYLRRQ